MAQQRKFIYAQAANGLTVRIPEEHFEAWQKGQDEIRAGMSEADRQTAALLASLIKGE